MYVVDQVWSCATRPGNILTVWDCESTNRNCRVRIVVSTNIEHRVHQAAFLTSVAQHSMCTRYYDDIMIGKGGLEPTTIWSRGRHANHHTTNQVQIRSPGYCGGIVPVGINIYFWSIFTEFS